MLFEWDPVKAERNFRKHGVSFEMAQTVFDDPLHLSVLDSKSHQEERWLTVGRSADMKTVVVVHTYFGRETTEVIRIISAQRAAKREVKQYEEGI